MNTKSAIEMTAKELRDIYSENVMDEGERAGRVINLALNLIEQGDVRISVSEFRNGFYPHLISEDNEEAIYFRKQLAARIGGEEQGFCIVSDDNPEDVLFRIPSLQLRFNTQILTSEEDIITNGITSRSQNFYRSQMSESPNNRKRHIVAISEDARSILRIDDAKLQYLLGWYEIYDFMGKLPDEDEKVYAPYRELQEKNNLWFYWVKDESISKYLGRDKQDVKLLPGAKGVTGTTQQIEVEDTSDWE